MRVFRDRRETPAADRERTRTLRTRVAETGESALRVWYPPPQVAFGRRDAAGEGFEAAREAAADAGLPPTERETGGRAVAFTGDVLAVARAEPVDPTAPAIEARYEATLAALEDALDALGVAVERGEPPAAWCPGTRSLRAADGGGKLAGLAQRVRRDVAIVAGAVVVRDADAVADALAPVYDALDVDFDPTSVGSVAAAAGGAVDPGRIRDAVEEVLVGEREPTIERI